LRDIKDGSVRYVTGSYGSRKVLAEPWVLYASNIVWEGTRLIDEFFFFGFILLFMLAFVLIAYLWSEDHPIYLHASRIVRHLPHVIEGGVWLDRNDRKVTYR